MSDCLVNNPDLIANADLDQLKAGYAEGPDHYQCLCCGVTFEKGMIYPEDDRLYEAEKYTRRHIEKQHQSVFQHLVRLDKSITGLTELQSRLLECFYLGMSDGEVQQELSIGSSSTIRNHRFALKERERQARVFLAIMELLRANGTDTPARTAPVKKAARTERAQILAKYFPYGTEGPLSSLSMKEKHRRIVLAEVAGRFQPGRQYTEPEVNQLLEAIHEDHVTLRRYLIDYGLISRQPDGSRYWRSAPANRNEGDRMDRKELKRLAKEIKTEAGVFQIRNNQNGKLFIGATRNLKTINGQQFQLEMGSHRNQLLQREWNQFGAEAFTFEVLEVLEKSETGYSDEEDELKKLRAKWFDRLQPFGERGYHQEGKLD